MLLPYWKVMNAVVSLAALAGVLVAASADRVWAVQCVNGPKMSWLRTTTDPPFEDERAIMKLIHRYNWALDEHLPGRLTDIFEPSITYELCNAAGDQLTEKKGDGQLQGYLVEYFGLFKVYMSQPRHIASNTLLHQVDANTVQGKTTVVVTLQHSDIETPVLDYTGELRTEFEKSAGIWRFSKMTLIVDGPQLTLRAR